MKNNDRYRKKLEEDYEDSFLRLIMYEYAVIEREELLKEAEEARNNPQYQPSEKLVKWFYGMCEKFFGKQKCSRQQGEI